MERVIWVSWYFLTSVVKCYLWPRLQQAAGLFDFDTLSQTNISAEFFCEQVDNLDNL